MAHNSVLRIKEKSWTAGFGNDKTKGNYIVGQKKLEFEVTWKPEMQPQIIPFVDSKGHQGFRVIVERMIPNVPIE